MRRYSLPILVVVLVLLATAIGGPGFAQDASPVMTGGHPLIGVWLVDTDTDDGENPPSSIVFHADGTYLQVDVDGTAVGVWEMTGDRSGAATFAFHGRDDAGVVSSTIVRAAVDVTEDGQGFTASYTVDFSAPDGTSSGELGPGTAAGTRMTVDPMGTPVGPLGPAASPTTSPDAGPQASAAAGITGAAASDGAACTLEYQRADNMWAAAGRPDGTLGIETINLLPGQRKVFITDWAYEKRVNDGSNYYGSHLRLARVPAGSGGTAFKITTVLSTFRLQAGYGWYTYKNDLKEVWCP